MSTAESVSSESLAQHLLPRRLRALLSADHSEEEFEVSLEELLDRLDRELSQ